MLYVDFGAFEYHGLVTIAFDEAQVAAADFGAFEYHGLVTLAYAVEAPALSRLMMEADLGKALYDGALRC